ncbi:CRP/FNR family transcriptional regulator, transcriptional activator FtrB [Tistlia consotensis]|uniref:CRP/FNR family transcriptional regulator, transcriptional activator FtrB n=1 Tax=Tistlia consotensis USBA 355 TaxID=560819 RepID=A0A1Y6BGF7_9PROT|nr:cyclic nucleotide-binding domain-containing protein [Tistlia consotensis]SMF02023.1 CRP/FNR family transcriptional regulator, transcriptional activator FtrB [Tistlia consotensis USBA 355]SNS26217.1 CRP/FNR family transcriptional regulator, transcriptional activator FtrB [Tistlia consotensis]
MRNEDLKRIRDLDLFANMRPENFEALTQAAFLQRFPEQVTLIREGDPADFLHVVTAGAVELYASAGGRETTLELVRPVSTFILAAVLRDQAYLMSARTLERSQILMIPATSVREVFAADEAFARAIVDELAGRFRTVVKALKNQKLRSSVERLANYLLRLQQEQDDGPRVELPVDKRTIASLLGMTPENLSRAFGTLAPYGVRVEGRTLFLDKPEDLRGLAKPSPLIDDPTS